MGLLQNEDFKTEAELISAGGVKAQLLNDTKVYMTGLAQTLDDAVSMGLIGGGGATGIIAGDNNIPKSTIGSWLVYADAAGVSPVDMSGGSPNSTLTRNTTTPISDVADFLFTKNSGASRQGEGISLTLTSIPNKYKSRACIFRFKYLTSSTYFDNAVGLFLYDITGAAVYQLNPLYLKKSGLIESSFAEIQLPATLTSGFRIGFHVIGTDTTAYTINFSEFTFDEKVSSQNSSITDERSFIPTGSWTGAVTYTGKERRIGNYAEYQVKILCSGAPTGTTLYLNLPRTIDTLSENGLINAAQYDVLSDSNVEVYDASGFWYEGRVQFFTTTQVVLSIIKTDGTYSNPASSISNTVPVTFASGDFLIVTFKIPILGWSAGTQISDIYTGRQSVTSAYKNADQNLTTNNTAQKLTLQLFEQDDFSQLDTTNNRINILKAGSYEIKSFQRFASTNVLNNVYELRLYKNGSQVRLIDFAVPTAATAFTLQGSTKIKLNVGDYVEFFIFGAGNNSASAYSARGLGGAIESFHSVTLDANASQVLASDVVYESWYGCVGYTIPNTFATSTNFIVPSKLFSTHSAYNPSTGVFTAPRSGLLKMFVNFYTNAFSSYTAGDYLGILMSKPTVASYPADISQWTYHFPAIGAVPAGGGFTLYANVVAGQQLACIIFSSRTGVVIPSEAGTSVRSNLIWEMR